MYKVNDEVHENAGIINVDIRPDRVELLIRKKSTRVPYRPDMDEVWKDIYSVIGGNIVLTKRVPAVIIPPKPEQFAFDEEKSISFIKRGNHGEESNN